MTAAQPIRDIPVSVRERLRNLAHEQRLDFQLVLDLYTCERFLYRLSASDEVDRFVLKGAALLRVWAQSEPRPTRDLDFLASDLEGRAAARAAVKAICRVPCPEDGVVFDSVTIRLAEIRHEQMTGGLRAKIRGSLGQARLNLQVDIGFDDIVTPGREEQDYSTLLDPLVFRLWTYPRETVVARGPRPCSRVTTRTPHAPGSGRSCGGRAPQGPRVRLVSWRREPCCGVFWDRSGTA